MQEGQGADEQAMDEIGEEGFLGNVDSDETVEDVLHGAMGHASEPRVANVEFLGTFLGVEGVDLSSSLDLGGHDSYDSDISMDRDLAFSSSESDESNADGSPMGGSDSDYSDE